MRQKNIYQINQSNKAIVNLTVTYKYCIQCISPILNQSNIIFREPIFNTVLLAKLLIVKEKRLKRKHQNGLKKEKTIGYPNLQKISISRVDSLINMQGYPLIEQ